MLAEPPPPDPPAAAAPGYFLEEPPPADVIFVVPSEPHTLNIVLLPFTPHCGSGDGPSCPPEPPAPIVTV